MKKGNSNNGLLTEGEAAEYLAVSPGFLKVARYRDDRVGPSFVKAGLRAIRYKISDLDAFIESRRVVKAGLK